MQAIKVGIVVDDAGTEDQVEDIMGLLEASDISCTLAIKHRGVHMLRDKDIDMLIVDYGGIARLGQMSAVEWQMNEARKWADEHPSKLMILWTPFTSQYYKEFNETLPAIENVLHNYSGEWEKICPKIKQWYGV